MARAAVDVNLVIDEAGDDLAESEQRLAERAVAAKWATAAPARTGNPDEHDERLARACKNSASHHPVPVLVPPTGIPGGFERARRLTASAGCRVIRLCPGGHGYPLVDWVLSPVPELCEREGVAVVLDFAPEAVKWAEAVAFARRYSPVRMVILETARRTTENAEGLGEQDRAAILSENAQALRDGAYAEAWL